MIAIGNFFTIVVKRDTFLTYPLKRDLSVANIKIAFKILRDFKYIQTIFS